MGLYKICKEMWIKYGELTENLWKGVAAHAVPADSLITVTQNVPYEII